MTAVIHVAGWTLVHFVWQAGVLGLAAGATLWMLRSASAQTRYAVACGALAGMLAAPIATARLLSVADRAVPPTGQSIVPTQRTAAHAPVVRTATISAYGASVRAPRVRLDAILPGVVTVWLSGVVLLLMRLAGGWWRVRALHQRALALPSSPWQTVSDRIAARLTVTRRVRIVDSPRIDTPTVLGWLRPVVLLPVAALANLAPAQVEALLAHELAHVRRHDYLVNLLQTVAETLLFYHPAVWWVSGRIRAEREHCCDDEAVRACGDRVGYASALAELEAWRMEQPRALALGATGGSLLRRVRRVLLLPPAHNPTSPGVLTTLAALLLLLTLAGGRALALAQAPARPQFDVISIKPVPANLPSGSWRYAPGRMTGTFSVKVLISLAFGTPDRIQFPPQQIVDGPEWIDTERFTINAKAPLDGQMDTSVPSRFGRPVAPFLRSLLEDRFKLVTHMDTREFPVYALVVARSDKRLGPKLHRSALTAADCEARRQHPSPDARQCGSFLRPGDPLTGVPVSRAIGFLGPVDRIVLDRTGLDGLFDMEFQRDESVSIFTAVQEQLGLKLEPRREPLEAIVVDRVEHPTPD